MKKTVLVFCSLLLTVLMLSGCLSGCVKTAVPDDIPDNPKEETGDNLPDGTGNDIEDDTEEGHEEGPEPDENGDEQGEEPAEPDEGKEDDITVPDEEFDGLRFYIKTDKCDEKLFETVEFAASMFEAAGVLTRDEYIVTTGLGFDINAGDIMIDGFASPDAEDYQISVYNGATIISSNSSVINTGTGKYNWVLYALNTLLKTYMTSGEELENGSSTIYTFDTNERILMLDCARKKWSVGFIKNLISEMSWMGYNTLELHITEEQGMRFNIWEDREGNKVPDCNGNDFSGLCGGTVVSWNSKYPEKVDAYYTRDDIEEIMLWAQKNHIDIIPAVDLPGHSYNLIVRADNLLLSGGLPFNYGGKEYAADGAVYVEAVGSGSGTVNIAMEYARSLSMAVCEAYAEYFRDFGCTSFNICGDEVSVDDSSWDAYALENGGVNAFDAFIIYMNTLSGMLKEKGYSVRAYNDYLFSQESTVELDSDIDICYWSESKAKTPVNIADEGRGLYNCVSSYTYYVLRNNSTYGDARDEDCAWWAFHHSTPERIYSGCEGKCGYGGCSGTDGWNPSRFWQYNAKDRQSVKPESVLGGYFLIWGDWAGWDTEDNIFFGRGEYNLIDRMWANITKMIDWDINETVDYETFRAGTELIRFSPMIDMLHIN